MEKIVKKNKNKKSLKTKVPSKLTEEKVEKLLPEIAVQVSKKIKSKKNKIKPEIEAENGGEVEIKKPKTKKNKAVEVAPKVKKQPEEEVVQEEIKDDGEELNVLIPRKKIDNLVKNFVKAYKFDIGENPEKSLLEDEPIRFLEVTPHKIPDCPEYLIRLYLPNPLVSKDAEICVIVADEKRGRKFDDEPHVHNVEQKLKEEGIDYINKVMTLSRLVKDYSSFEEKRKLANTYDCFLVETKISKQVGKFFGVIFKKAKKIPRPFDTFTKKRIDKAISCSTFEMKSCGAITSIMVATGNHNEKQFAENLESVINDLKFKYPGGWGNIRTLVLRYAKTTIPIFMNKFMANSLPIPVIKSKKDVAMEKLLKTDINPKILKSVKVLDTKASIRREKERQMNKEEDEESGVEMDSEEEVEKPVVVKKEKPVKMEKEPKVNGVKEAPIKAEKKVGKKRERLTSETVVAEPVVSKKSKKTKQK